MTLSANALFLALFALPLAATAVRASLTTAWPWLASAILLGRAYALATLFLVDRSLYPAASAERRFRPRGAFPAVLAGISSGCAGVGDERVAQRRDRRAPPQSSPAWHSRVVQCGPSTQVVADS